MANPITIRIDGKAMLVNAGTSAAAAILNSGVSGVRRSVSGEPRGPVCGMGVCYECRATIDGVLHQRSCMVTCTDGMEISTDD
jgi:sarcosine oxidase subunit alpha